MAHLVYLPITNHLCAYRRKNPGEWVVETDVEQLFLTTGEDQPIQGKAVYFVRMEDSDKANAIDVNVACDSTVLAGELSKDMLKDLESFLDVLYLPQLKQSNDGAKLVRSNARSLLVRLSVFEMILAKR